MDESILELIQNELTHQDKKWGADRILDSRLWMTIIGEEFGEACKAALEHDGAAYVGELVDVAASAISAIKSFYLELNKQA